MKRLAICSLPLVLIFSAQAAEPLLEKIDLFTPGMNAIAHYRIPGIVLTAKGTLLAYCEARKLDRKDWGEIEIHLRRSTDGGRTWEPARQIAHFGKRIEGNPRKTSGGEREQTVNNPVAIVDRQTGAIEFLYCINYARCFGMRSTDDGLTFSKPVEITAAFEPFRGRYPWKVIATGPGHGIQLAGGRLVVPIWLAYGEAGEHAPSASGTIFSDDHGKSWKAGDIVVPNEGPFKNASESALAQLADARVMMVTRSVSDPSRKLVSTSPDGARNWTTPKFHPDLWEPICMAGITNYSREPGTLIFSNPHSLQRDESGREIPGGRGRRENLSIKLSRDQGQTWPVNKTLEAGPSAYSDLAVLADGTVICFYERGTQLAVARFNLEWLTGGSAAAPVSGGPTGAETKPRVRQTSHPAENPSGSRPNVLLIVSEDNGPELGCYGDRYARTPNLDRLADGGVRFNRAFVTQAGCSQSRSSIHTGLYPHQNGQIGLATWGFRMYREDTPNLARRLKEAGYRTGIVGKLHINPESAFPFDFQKIPTGNFARKNLGDYAKHAETFFKAGEAPFYLSVNYPDAHNPWPKQVDGLPKQPLEAGDVKSLPYFGLDTPKLRELNANYFFANQGLLAAKTGSGRPARTR